MCGIVAVDISDISSDQIEEVKRVLIETEIRGRPFRYAINTYCLKHTDTIEFRLFRSSINEREIHDSLMFVENFIDAALNDGPSVEEILKQHNYLFPRFIYDPEMSRAWKETKHSSDISKKVRTLYEVS